MLSTIKPNSKILANLAKLPTKRPKTGIVTYPLLGKLHLAKMDRVLMFVILTLANSNNKLIHRVKTKCDNKLLPSHKNQDSKRSKCTSLRANICSNGLRVVTRSVSLEPSQIGSRCHFKKYKTGSGSFYYKDLTRSLREYINLNLL